MKVNKEQLRTIIKEEKARLHENRMLQLQLVDEIVDLLIERGAVDDRDKLDDDLYQDALDYMRGAIIPALRDLASRGAYDRK